MEDLLAFVPNVHFEQIPIRNLVSNQEYQRNLSAKHVEKAAANFDLYQINPVKVSRRDGINYVFNGQHTIEIIATVSRSRDTPVWCMIYDELEYSHEAEIFANQMKHVKPLVPYEIFKAHIEAGSDKHLMIKGLVESYDLIICSNRQTGGICAVAALEGIYDHYGYEILERVLYLLVGTWEGTPEAYTANMLNGVAKLVYAYGKNLKDGTFKEKCGAVSIKEISRTAKERRAGSLGYAESLLLLYNKRNRSPLPQATLYSTKKRKKRRPDLDASLSATDMATLEDNNSQFSLDV